MSLYSVKKHVEDNKTAYIVVGSMVMGLVVGRILFGSKAIIHNSAVASPIVNISSKVTNGGYTHKIVKCLETGQIWETVKDAAEAMEVSPSMMSKHINGHKDHISNLHFTIVGLGANG